MKRIYGVIVIGVAFASWFFFLRGNSANDEEFIYRTEKVTRGTLTLSITSSGVLQPLTMVDVKSKAGGEVVVMAVTEGSVVKKGDLIAVIDPRDTKALYEQANADLHASIARKTQNKLTYEMQIVQSEAAVENACSALAAARARLKRLEEQARIQPTLSQANIEQAQANYDSAVQAFNLLEKVTIPQQRAEAKGEFERTKAELDSAEANLERMESLLQKGYVSKAQVDQAKADYQAALAAYRNAEQRLKTLEDDFKIRLETAKAQVNDALAALKQAKANEAQVNFAQRDYQEAKEAVRQAELALKQAEANRKNIALRKAEMEAAEAAIVRNRVARDNAKVQLDSTTVVAPRDGVVVRKYVEEGTIIPPGTSIFSEGTSIVQIADVSKMYVEVLVDEADIGKVRVGQNVRVRLESHPSIPIPGTVSRINPSAETTNGVTQIKVRVELPTKHQQSEVKLLPGLNASCEFILNEKKDVLIVPMQAVRREGKETYVEVMVKKNQLVRRNVRLGIVGNTGYEVLEGLKEGEEVVTSKISKEQILEQQKRMEEAQQQRNPFSGGSGGRGGGGMGAPSGGLRIR